jgi:hypothetical protein
VLDKNIHGAGAFLFRPRQQPLAQNAAVSGHLSLLPSTGGPQWRRRLIEANRAAIKKVARDPEAGRPTDRDPAI